ncbi:hypothetical protein [Streptomyces sp. FIT100]|uniref:hypothetical protein n=1 Tax=Streptomyces sp. FIT100 TaxID=2837956 RepID=UPI0037DA67D9
MLSILSGTADRTGIDRSPPEAYAEPVRARTQVALRAVVACGAGADAEDGTAFRPWPLRIVATETRNTVRSAVR